MRPEPVGDLRAASRWLGEHAPLRILFPRAARRGDVLARLDREPALRADPFGAYEQLRAQGRLVQGALIKATVDHALTTAILRHPQTRVVDGASTLPAPLQRLIRFGQDPWAVGPVDPPSLLAVDPPDHTRFRRLVSRAFTARAVRAQEARMEVTAHRLLDDIERAGPRVDLVEAYSSLLPVAVIGDILGVPPGDHRQLLAWGNDAGVLLDPALSWSRFRRANRAVRGLHRWVDEHVEAKRREPGDDLLSQLALLEGDDALGDVELRMVALLVLAAGFETTVNLISNAVVQLDRHPAQRERLLAEPAGWAGAVEETLRFDSPVQNSIRHVPETVELDGVEVPGGSVVLLYLGGANRDPAVFERPHEFDVARENAGDHLAFSSGIHYCLGAQLARSEAAIGLRMLYERFPDLRVDGDPVRRGTRVLRGFDHVPIRPRSTARQPA